MTYYRLSDLELRLALLLSVGGSYVEFVRALYRRHAIERRQL